ncbi:exo-alpha-sialidase [Streptomyces virginiae]
MSAARPALGGNGEEHGPVLVIRVSRDGGRTYGPPVTVDPDRDVVPEITSKWPPCRCVIHCPAPPAP